MVNTDDELTQAMHDLPACKQDVETFATAMERYQLNDPQNIYYLDKDPKFSEVHATKMTIMKRINKKPD